MICLFLQVRPTENELDQLFENIDTDRSGTISAEEFERWRKRPRNTAAAAAVPACMILYFKCPLLSISLVDAGRSPVLTASIDNVQAGLGMFDGEMDGRFELESIGIYGASKECSLLKTVAKSGNSFMEVAVTKTKVDEAGTVHFTAVKASVDAELALEWHPATVQNAFVQVNVLVQASPEEFDTAKEKAAEKAAAAAAAATAAASHSDAAALPSEPAILAEAMMVEADWSKLSVSLKSRATNQTLYTAALNDISFHMLDTSALTKDQRLLLASKHGPYKPHCFQGHGAPLGQKQGRKRTPYTPNLHCGVHLGEIMVQDLCNPLQTDIIKPVHQEKHMIDLSYNMFDAEAAAAMKIDSETELVMNALSVCIIPDTITELLSYVTADVAGALAAQAPAARCGSYSDGAMEGLKDRDISNDDEQPFVTRQDAKKLNRDAKKKQQEEEAAKARARRNIVTVTVKGPHVLAYPFGRDRPMCLKTTHFPDVKRAFQ